MNQFELALEFYKGATPSILTEKQNSWALDPSSFGEYFRMTPIESAIWERIREVRQWPDGLLYVLTDSANGKLIRLLPNASGQ